MVGKLVVDHSQVAPAGGGNRTQPTHNIVIYIYDFQYQNGRLEKMKWQVASSLLILPQFIMDYIYRP